ncbi:MAG TPA: ATP-binding cassette domain-containing protein [Terriglobales bacterium]|nr:ATP-binding cassette domain-containing protein [Terriglobales bacterium]
MPPDSHALLELRNVRVVRGMKTVLDDFNLRIENGEHVAILGPNGCGKSTLIKTITRELYPVSRPGSSITILGEDSWNVFELRSLLGIVSNDLMSWCTGGAVGRDVVLSGFFSSNDVYANHLVTAEQIERADAALEQLQVLHMADRPVSEMSSGEARRVLIARALVHQPRALLFDEPSNSLDLFAHHALRETMSQLARSGIGIVLVTHDLSDVIPEIERVVLMSKGQIVADGRKHDILQPARISEVFGLKVEVARRDGYYYSW